MHKEIGGLIKKKNKPTMQPPIPVKKTQDDDFAFNPTPTQKPEVIVDTTTSIYDDSKIVQPKTKKASSVGKSNSTKSIKVPTHVHTQINLLGSFMDENKTYAILQNLIDSYVKNELSNRQQKQFEFMVRAFNEANK